NNNPCALVGAWSGDQSPAGAPLVTGPSDRAYLIISLRTLSGRARTMLRAGLALIVIGSLVNGLMPGRALVAGLWTSFSLIRPGMVNWPGPFLFSWVLTSPARAAKTSATCFRVSLVLLASS